MGALEKAMFYDSKEKQPVYVQFNPNTLEYRYAEDRSPGGGPSGETAPGSGIQNGWPVDWFRQQSPLNTRKGAQLSMRLFFNTYTSETSYTDVREKIKSLRAFLCKTEGTQTVNKKVTFAWGSLGFEGYLNSLSITYQMFASDGTPVQAEASISIEGDDKDLSTDNVARKTEEISRDDSVKKSFGWLFE